MNNKTAIVGMEALFGADEGLDVFDRSIFDGIQPSILTTSDRQKKIRWGTASRCKEHYLRLLKESEPLNATSLLRIATEGVLKNTLSKPQWGDIALLVVSDSDVPDLQVSPERFSQEVSVSLALQKAQDLLLAQEVQGVIIGAAHHRNSLAASEEESAIFDNGLHIGEGACAILLKQADQARLDQDRIYAIFDAVVVNPTNKTVADTCQKASDIADIELEQISYIELMGDGIEEEYPSEIQGLAQVYLREGEELTCALGSVKGNIGYTSPASELASVIRSALSLYHRYIPATPLWTNPKNVTEWEKSPFYVVTESRPWFVNKACPKRIAALSSVESGGIAHMILSEDSAQQHHSSDYLALVAPYCFPMAGENQSDLMRQLAKLQQILEDTESSLPIIARNSLDLFEKRSDAPYALMIVGYTRGELLEETQFMLKGIPSAFAEGGELKTPKGTFFTADPLGVDGNVAFVYPGVGSAYVGLGQSMSHLFPSVYDQLSELTADMGDLLKDKELYPRSRERLTSDQIWKMELQMRRDINTVGKSGMGFFALYTMILRDIFRVTPHCALGYSMGEPGMMASLGVWPDPLQLTDKFNNSPTFRERLHGKLEAVREYWKLSKHGNGSQERVWDSYTLQTTPAVVRDALKEEEHVFLTIINSPEEVVIAGDPEGCMRIVKKLDCKYYALNFDLAIHCAPTRLEYDRIVDLYTLPVNTSPGIKFYSSSCYKPIPIRSKSVAHSIAKAFSETVDFPRLVNQAYEDGARLFIEIGSRKFCCNMIERILKGKEHLAIPMNVKGVKDQTSIVRVLAQLVSHRVPVNLTPVF